MTVLVAGIGNVFLGDDGFGVEVANRLLQRGASPAGVRVVEYGIRGLHLAFDVLDGVDCLVLVDAIASGEPPGTVTVLEVDPEDVAGTDGAVLDAHSMSPDTVLASIARLGGTVGRVYVVGCEPASVREGIGLSELVAGAVPAAVEAIDDLLATLGAGAARSSAGQGREA